MSEHADDPGPADGGLGGETVRILSAVQDWANRAFPESAEQHRDGTCQWCPICQLIAVLRGERPEVTERLAEAGTALLGAFRAFVDATVPPSAGPGAHGDEARDTAGRVQHIDLGADPDE